MKAGLLRAGATRQLILLCLGAFLIRFATGYFFPNIAHPDETFQYLEQAYRLITGRGLIPWEYHVGARSWLLAWMVVPVEATALTFSSDPAVLRNSVVLFLSLLSTAAVAAAYRIGLHSGGQRHAVLAALLTAFWCEIVYMATHMLADSLSAVSLLVAIAVGIRGRDGPMRETILAGLMFGLTIVIRPQLGPACALAMLWMTGIRPGPRWLAMAAGFAMPVLLLGVTDWISWGAPFHSLRTYLYVNSSGVANLFGVEPPSYYLAREIEIWGLALPVIALTALLGLRRAPVLAMVMLLVFATFSAVPHKEWRFIFPALPVLFVLCGIGTAELNIWLASRTGRRRLRPITAVSVVLWLSLSLLIGVRGTMQSHWVNNVGTINAYDMASADPAACAVGIDPADRWARAGMVRLRPDMRLYRATPTTTERFNYLVSIDDPMEPGRLSPLGFRQIACFPKQVCLYKRPGPCKPSPDEMTAPPGSGVGELLKKLGTH